jgi:hypothetical protein
MLIYNILQGYSSRGISQTPQIPENALHLKGLEGTFDLVA